MPHFAKDIRTVPNQITLARIVLLGVGVACYFQGQIGLGLIFGALAGVTDYLDGIIARRTGQVTYLGAILDQFSDLLLEATCLLLLVEHPLGPPPWLLLVYLFREFWATTIRRFMAAHGIDIKSSFLGKLKTNMVGWGFIPWFVYVTDFIPVIGPYAHILGMIGLYGGLAVGYVSGWQYTRQFIAGYDKLESAD
ncbi:MAG: CDP-alcohol phosphatidyltransferase family protein [Myxococcales bacterium]|nr:CDP-alcohol phosphatidyltransferase family protein [Myxococcales bacterium]MCB9546822.1 CDP-alcohol phosphatidyltransferase family protein [Myxococcales bacterium]